MTIPKMIAVACLTLLTLNTTHAADDFLNELDALQQHHHAKSPFASNYKPAANGRNYAPDRLAQINHLAITLTPDFQTRTIEATTTLTFTPIANPLTELRLDAVDLNIQSVTASTPVDDYHTTEDALFITFKNPIAPNTQSSVTIAYHAQPTTGLYFRTPDMGYHKDDTHLWTQGESHLHRHWFPSYDYPNQKFTTEITATVPADMTVIANGSITSNTTNPSSKLKTVTWRQNQPHSNYLVALVIGYFDELTDTTHRVPMSFFTPVSKAKHAQNSFKTTADTMTFFEDELQTPYPWDRYNQAIVDDFIAGGMENTTLTILTTGTLHPPQNQDLRTSQSLVAHELAHQWFGDYLTCKDWSHLWLNEGFATYYAHLYDRHRNGAASMNYGLLRNLRSLTRANDKRPIVYKNYKDPGDQFDSRAYAKGGWVLHMLHSQLGDTLYQKTIATYLKNNAFKNVITQDLINAAEQTTGLSLQQFFDQWVFHGGTPQLTVTQSWDPKTKLAKVTVKQTHKTDSQVLLFNLPTSIRFLTDQGPIDHPITISQTSQDFYVSLPAKPNNVRFDPNLTILAKTTFSKPTTMLITQLQNTDDTTGQLIAIEALKNKKDAKTLAALKHALNNDSFYGVRVEAAKALRSINSNDSLAILINALNNDNPRARSQVVSSVAAFYHQDARDALTAHLKTESNPQIKASALASLGKYSPTKFRKTLIAALNSTSHRNTLANAAISAIRAIDSPSYIKPLTTTLTQHEARFTSRSFGRALDTLAYLARNRNNPTNTRNFIASQLDHPKSSVQSAALKALGTLADTRAIPIVQSFDTDSQANPTQKAAAAALKSLYAKKELPVELRDLRAQVLKLQKASEELNKKFDDLNNKNDATKNIDDDDDATKNDDGDDDNDK